MAASSSSRTTTSAFRRVAPRGPAVDLDRRWRHSAGVGRLRGAAYRVARRWRPAVQAGQLPVRSGESHLVVRRWIRVVGPLMILGAKRDAETESRRLYIMCMEARGYSQVKPGGPYLGLNARPDERGLRIQSLVPGGPAENAGLRLDDIISEMDDRRIAVLDDLRAVVDSKSPGDRVNLVVVRDGVAQRITL